jgi:hypothetical protein
MSTALRRRQLQTGRRVPQGPASASGIAEVLAPMGTDWLAWWSVYDADLPNHPGISLATGNELGSWTDQIGGLVLNAVSSGARPMYAVDAGNFGERPVVQTYQTGTKYLVGTFGTPIMTVASSPNPEMVIVCRSREPISGGGEFILALTEGTTFRTLLYWWTSDNSLRFQDPALVELNYGAGSGNRFPSIISARLDNQAAGVDGDAVGSRIRKRPGATVSNATASVLNGNVTRVTVGNGGHYTGAPADMSVAEIFLFKRKLDTLQDPLFLALQSKWTIS